MANLLASIPSAPASPQLTCMTLASVSPQRIKAKQRLATKAHVSCSILSPSKAQRRSRIVFDFTAEEMAKYYHLPQREAAKLLGVAVITIKRTCKRRGIRWPYRDAKLKQFQDARARGATRRFQQQQPELRHGAPGMKLLSEAALAFARLPFDCMAENTQGSVRV